MHDTRRHRFEKLAGRYPSQKAMAEALGLAQPHVSQILAGIRALGDIAVQRIERALHLPDGWFDSETMPPAVEEVAISFDIPKRPGPRPRRQPQELRQELAAHFVRPERSQLPQAPEPSFREQELMAREQEDRDIADAIATLTDDPAIEPFFEVRFGGPLGFSQIDMVFPRNGYDVAVEILRIPADRYSLARAKDRLIAQLVKLKHCAKPRPLRIAIVYKLTESRHMGQNPLPIDVVEHSLEQHLGMLRALEYIDSYAGYPNLGPLKAIL